MYNAFIVYTGCHQLEKPMKAAPGAQLPIKDIFGRDQFIAALWRVLAGNSVRMEAERRIGKTSILHKMEAEPPIGWGFRMVLCGSIGLHHVLGSLKQQGYKNQPVNDMTLVEVPPLDPPVASELATCLLVGEGLTGDPTAPRIIAEQTGGFPYYI